MNSTDNTGWKVKLKIVRDTVCLYQKYGIKALSMGDVARLNGISQKALNGYFPTKTALLRACIGYRIYQEDLFGYTEGRLLDILLNYAETFSRLHQKMNRRCCMDIKKYYPSIYVFLTEIMTRFAFVCQKKVEEGISTGYIRKNIYPDLVYVFLRENFFRLFTIEVVDQEYGNRMMTEIIFAFIRGISTEKGRAYMDKELKIRIQYEAD